MGKNQGNVERVMLQQNSPSEIDGDPQDGNQKGGANRSYLYTEQKVLRRTKDIAYFFPD